MSARYAELDWQQTPMGAISLRRRRHPLLDVEVFEAKLDDEHLMSTLFTDAEEALARLGLTELTDEREGIDVLVGGLGLGYTAVAALEDARVRHLVVVEALQPVIDWHHRGLLPLSAQLLSDDRTQLLCSDFFHLTDDAALAATNPGRRRYDAVLVDIDHTPTHVLHPSHARFYTPDGLARLRGQIAPGGVFGLWSDGDPDPRFLDVLAACFAGAVAERVEFANPLTRGISASTVYLARVSS